MQCFHQLRVTVKLILSFSLVAAVGAAVGGFGIFHMARISALTESLYSHELRSVKAIQEANIHLLYASWAQMSLLSASTLGQRKGEATGIKTAMASLEERMGEVESLFQLPAYDAVTRIANAPEHIKGVVNLRSPTYDRFTVVIILNIASRVMGMVVDSISDAITLTAEQIKLAPAMGSVLDTDYLIGLGKLDERLLILVDTDRLMSSSEMGLIEKLTA